MTESKQWSTGRRSHKSQHLLTLLGSHLVHDLPEQLDGRMLLIVITDRIYTPILRVPSEVLHVDVARFTTYQGLQLGLVEHGQPSRLDYLAQSLEKCVGLQSRLNLQAVSGNVGYVHQAILVSDGSLGAIVSQLLSHSTHMRSWYRNRVCNGKVQRKVFNIIRIVLQLQLKGRQQPRQAT